MARPEREKRICRKPLYRRFAPVGEKAPGNPITLSIEEYETIRWIDLEGASREECAYRMDIARTTAQAIYNSARAKIAESIVGGRELQIGGGRFRVCDGSAGCTSCCKANHKGSDKPKLVNISQRKENEMRIAVTYKDGNVFQHFGHTEYFKIYEVEEGKVLSSDVYSSQGAGHGALSAVLSAADVSVLICGGIGGGAINALAAAGIKVISGASGNTDEAVKEYLAGNLTSTGSNCSHHHHAEGHVCGNHGCGSGGCH